jgi:YD repeat-containing protein
VRKTWDGKGNLSQLEYASTYHYAYLTHTISAVPDPSGVRGTNTPLESWTAYDLATGKVTSTTDANGKTTVLKYVDDEIANSPPDALDRLRKVEEPDGGWTRYSYGHNAYGDYVSTRTSINATQNTESRQFFDGLGRSVRSFGWEGSQWITSDTEYDALGRVKRVSNPYLSGGEGTAINPPGNWTTTAYDALGRVSTVTTPDTAQVSTAYSGNTVTVTDQAGKQRRSVTDALGRLSQVVEAPVGVAYQTNYTYDVLGNLRKVDQGGQLRFFMYDSLGRLVRAKNPEQSINSNLNTSADPVSGNMQWSLSYAYDNNGNLSSKTDARGITSIYQYDNINRNTNIDYSDTTTVNPDVMRYYDGAVNGRGRFWYNYKVESQTWECTAVDSYDTMGRVTQQRQQFHTNSVWSPFYSVTRSYNRMGHVTAQTYPSGRTVSYSQFDVAGRLKQFTGNLGDGVTRTYATNITYDEASRMQEEQFGTNTALYHKLHYNVRGQLYDVRLSTVAWATDQWNWNRGALVNYFSSVNGLAVSGPENNGNVLLA